MTNNPAVSKATRYTFLFFLVQTDMFSLKFQRKSSPGNMSKQTNKNVSHCLNAWQQIISLKSNQVCQQNSPSQCFPVLLGSLRGGRHSWTIHHQPPGTPAPALDQPQQQRLKRKIDFYQTCQKYLSLSYLACLLVLTVELTAAGALYCNSKVAAAAASLTRVGP